MKTPPKKKPTPKPQMHVVVRDAGDRHWMLNQSGNWITVDTRMTIGEMIERGFTVRIHHPKRSLTEEDFKL